MMGFRDVVEVTAAFLAECRRKQDAYAASRRRHTDGYREPEGDWAETWDEVLGQASTGSSPAAPRPSRRTPMHDRSQRTLALV
ncbi:MAG TPA: hypothetical protein VGL95_01955 [Acetobacteraceae bacterium]|jgi:hypothetical protein